MGQRAFDPDSPGARRLAHLAQQLRTDFAPVRIAVVEPILDLDGAPRRLKPGETAYVRARSAHFFVARGSATYVDG